MELRSLRRGDLESAVPWFSQRPIALYVFGLWPTRLQLIRPRVMRIAAGERMAPFGKKLVIELKSCIIFHSLAIHVEVYFFSNGNARKSCCAVYLNKHRFWGFKHSCINNQLYTVLVLRRTRACCITVTHLLAVHLLFLT